MSNEKNTTDDVTTASAAVEPAQEAPSADEPQATDEFDETPAEPAEEVSTDDADDETAAATTTLVKTTTPVATAEPEATAGVAIDEEPGVEGMPLAEAASTTEPADDASFDLFTAPPVQSPPTEPAPAPAPVFAVDTPTAEPARRRLRVGTVVWGLILAACGLGVIAWASGARIDFQLALIILLAVAGTALLVGSIVSGARHARH